MKHAKLIILLCGLVGLAEQILPFGAGSRFRLYYDQDVGAAIVLLAVFALPTVMALLARPRLAAWQAGVALAGFTLGVVKLRVWDDLRHLPSLGVHGTLSVAALVIGTVTAALALLRPPADPA